ncbi:MAG: hydroxymethylbilane synthase [Acidobacteriota bacterium]
MTLRLGARGSALSRAQAEQIRAALADRAEVEMVTVQTTGDRLSTSGQPIGWKGDFTRELDEALLAGRIDLAVHSLKDVPSALPPGLVLAAVPRREDPSDVLVSRDRLTLAQLPRGAVVGTASPRRRAQILSARPDLSVAEARGNVDTRIRRLQEGRWDAIVLARAGLARLGRLEEIVEVFSESVVLPAVGQGALAVVTRAEDVATRESLRSLDDRSSHQEVLAERGFLAGLEAGCRAPVAGRARVLDVQSLRLVGAVYALDGSRTIRGSAEGSPDDAPFIGRELAERLLRQGAAELIGAPSR